ncbi:phage baseplate protein [Amedibacillus sp. YH-ame6]
MIPNQLSTFNPNKIYFGTTWVRHSQGRVLVGVDENDPDFSVSGKKIGHKNIQAHNHSASTSINSTSIAGQCRVLAHPAWIGGNSGALGIYDPSSREPFPSGNASAMAAYLRFNNTHGHSASTSIGSAGSGDAQNIQPSITTYMWVRTN